MTDLDEIIANFESVDDVMYKYEYLIELGGKLRALPPEAHSEQNRVPGCLAKVWLETSVEWDSPLDPVLTFRGDSDAKLVKGLVYLALCMYSGQKASEIVKTDAKSLFKRLGLGDQVTAQRSNGFASMIRRIRSDAARALTGSKVSPSLQ